MRFARHIGAALLLATLAGCSIASGQTGEAAGNQTPAGPPPGPPPQPPQGGPPPMPEPITMALRPDATGGEKAYVEKCMMCHGPNGMGTGLLGRRMKVALLEERKDLKKNYVILAARMGVGNMPAIPRGEVSDAQLAEIADYLAKGAVK